MKHYQSNFKILAIWIFIILFTQNGNAQNVIDKVREATNVEALEGLANTYKIKAQTQKELAWRVADEKGWAKRVTHPNGEVIELVGLDDSGAPLYYITDSNVIAAQSISTNRLWTGGSLGLSLTGLNMVTASGYARLGEWDGGAARTTHQEFNANGGSTVVQRDGATTLSDHATHVAGTMVAFGVSANAKGMSYQAQLDAHDWDNDASEMAIAASNGMLISNHSYGTVTGWRSSGGSWTWYGNPNLSQEEDFKFGYYDSRAKEWDDIAFNAPFYLICKSAGNDRGEGPGTAVTHQVSGSGSSTIYRPDDGGDVGYDCISTYGTAKNILTVGAVNDVANGYTNANGVTMSSFSGWGPTDDGRIKPDVCGNGVGVFSSTASSNTSYDTYNGTSMATPNVSGSLLLLQQHYQNLYGSGTFMRSATLKGLVIHTADEAGTSPGPDYRFGWGLVNVATAAQAITNAKNNTSSFVFDKTLSNNTSHTYQVTSNGQPLRATICWTDRSGTPVTAVNDSPVRMIVNDLDSRITYNGNTHQPWILDPANPANAATRGDNNRDNVEQILISPTVNAGVYTLTINHKGTLQGGSQRYALWITGASAVEDASAAPTVRFALPSTSIFENATTGIVNCRKYQDITTSVQITKPYTGTAQITLQTTGTATNVSDYAIISPTTLTFSGATTTQNVTVRVFDDRSVENGDVIVLSYAISGNSNIVADASNQTFTINIQDDDQHPTLGGSNTFLDENWTSGLLATNQWTSANLGGGNTKVGIYNISGDNKAGYDYGTGTQTNFDQTITSKVLNATNLQNITLDYQVHWNNYDNDNLCNLQVQYKTQSSSTWITLETFSNTTAFVTGDNLVTVNRGAQLLNGMAGNNFQIRFRFYGASDYSIDAILVDNIKVKGTQSAAIETSIASSTEYVSAGSTIHFYSNAGKIMATLDNLSAIDCGCTTLEIDADGTGATPYISTANTARTTQKSYKLSWGNPVTNLSYRLTLYYTNAEIQGWENATGRLRTQMTLIGSPNAMSTPIATAQYASLPTVSNIIGNTAVSIQGSFSRANVGFAGCVSELAEGPLSLERNNISNEVAIYPNPTTGQIRINFKNITVSPQTTWKLLDANGRTAGVWVGKPEEVEKEINELLAKTPKGLYLLHLQDDKTYFTRKIVKQ